MKELFFSLVLHAHLPFVRHPEYDEFLEEDWLFEALTEVYIPLIRIATHLAELRSKPRFTVTLSPTLCEMLSDSLLQARYARHLENLMTLAEKEVERTRHLARELAATAQMYSHSLREVHEFWETAIERDMIKAFRSLQDDNVVEIITCCATHALLPLVATEEGRRAQIDIAIENYRKHFQRLPRGFWLPECAFAAGVDKLLVESGIEYAIADSHAILFGEPRPRFGIHAPIRTRAGIVVFPRDHQSALQVWSADGGYPGDPAYREFYRDLGWDAPTDYLLPHLHRNGERRNLGFKYYRITDRKTPLEVKELYDPSAAQKRAKAHAKHFVSTRRGQAQMLQRYFDGQIPLLVAPYDAELFGHWWFEGPQFLRFVFDELDELAIKAMTPGDFIDSGTVIQSQEPAASSWGAGGYFQVWLNEKTSWMYPLLHAAERSMRTLADRFRGITYGSTRRALNQASRELLLAQSSDWAFHVSQQTAAAYAEKRFRTHIDAFESITRDVSTERIDEQTLGKVEQRDNLFPELDFQVFCSR